MAYPGAGAWAAGPFPAGVNLGKSAKDAAEWLPQRSQCWFVGTVIRVRAKYGLSVGAREKAALARVYSGCRQRDFW